MTAHPQQILEKLIETAGDEITSRAQLITGITNLDHGDIAQALALAVERLAR